MLPFLADTSGNDSSERTSAYSSSDNARHRRCSRHSAEEHRPWSSIASGGRLRLNNVEVVPCLVRHPRFLACLCLATAARRCLADDGLHPLISGAICGIATTRAKRSAGEPYQVGYQQCLLSSLDVRMAACRERGPSRLLPRFNPGIISLGTTIAAVSQGMTRRQPVRRYEFRSAFEQF